MTRRCITRASMLAVLVLAGLDGAAVHAQGPSVDELRRELSERYVIAARDRSLALLPRREDAGFRVIEISDGVVEVDGETLTGRQIRDRLGRDAELVLQASYLSREAQIELARGPAGPVPPAPGEPPAAPLPPEPPDPVPDIPRPQVRSGDLVRIGGSVSVARDERVEGEVVVVFGSANIDGEIEGEVTVVMGSLNLGPTAVVRDDVHVIGGSLNRQPGSRILGAVEEVGIGDRDFQRPEFGFPFPFLPWWERVGNVATTVLRMTLMVLAAIVAVALGRATVERVADRTAADAVRSGFVGLLAELLFIPLLVVVVVVLAVSIVGIPLLVLVPFGVLAVGVLMVVGFSGLAYQLGRMVTGRFGWTADNVYLTVTLGVVAIMAVTLVARLFSLAVGGFVGTPVAALGYMVEYIAWTIGFGATILVWFGSRRTPAAAGTPPPLPTTP